jgi:hypothetical protein
VTPPPGPRRSEARPAFWPGLRCYTFVPDFEVSGNGTNVQQTGTPPPFTESGLTLSTGSTRAPHHQLQQRTELCGDLGRDASDVIGARRVQCAAVRLVVEARRVDEVAERGVVAARAGSLQGLGGGEGPGGGGVVGRLKPKPILLPTCKFAPCAPSNGRRRAMGVPGQVTRRPFRTSIMAAVMLFAPSLVP